MKISDNRLLLWSIMALSAYWIIGSISPWTAFAPVVNLSLIIAAGLTFMRYAPDAAAIVFQGRRNEDAADGDGSHLAIYGLALIGLGGLFAAVTAFGLAIPEIRFYVAGQPIELFGRWLAVAGLGLVFVSPNVTRRGVKFDGGAWLYVVAAIAMAGVYAIGYGAGQREEVSALTERLDHIPADRPRCPVDRPVWGSDSGVYHTTLSPYRKLVFPVRCYASETEAEAAGFRAPE